jgi:hypothetical protein
MATLTADASGNATYMPVRKVITATAASAIATLVIAVINMIKPGTIDSTVATSITTAVAAIVGWLVPPAASEGQTQSTPTPAAAPIKP